MNKFWMVVKITKADEDLLESEDMDSFNVVGKPTVIHKTHGSAHDEAERLAGLAPNQKFAVVSYENHVESFPIETRWASPEGKAERLNEAAAHARAEAIR